MDGNKKNRRKNRKRGRRVAGIAPIDVSLLPSPSKVPDVQQVLRADRWVRFFIDRPATGDFVLALSVIGNALFGTSCIPGSHFYLKKVRVWTETSTQSLSIDIFASPIVTTRVAASSAVRYSAVSTIGQVQACISVQMPEIWRITPSIGSTVLVFYVARYVEGTVNATRLTVDCYVTSVQRGPDTLAFCGENVIEPDGFEHLKL